MPRIIEALNIGEQVLATPFRLIVAGGSGSGKTEFVKQIVNKQFYSDPIENVIYCYLDYLTDILTEFDVPVQYRAGLPDTSYLASVPDGSLIILDDMMIECAKCEAISKLFSVVARKRRISVILIVQNIYQQGRHFRSIRLNSTGVVLFKFRAAYDSNLRLLRDFGLNKYIERPQLEQALSEKHSYIFVDIHPNRQFDFGCIRGNIFQKEINCYYKMEYVAIPKSDFIKYFKIIDSKKGRITAIKNEIEIPKRKASKRCSKKISKRKRKSESSAESDSRSDDNRDGQSKSRNAESSTESETGTSGTESE